jgi:hypothetical protein
VSVISFLAYEQYPLRSQALIPRNVLNSDEHAAIHVVAQFLYTCSCNVKMDWYITTEPDQPLFIYEVSLPERTDGDRVAFCSLNLQGLKQDAQFPIHQEWIVKLYINHDLQKETSFFIKKGRYGSSYSSSTAGRIHLGV